MEHLLLELLESSDLSCLNGWITSMPLKQCSCLTSSPFAWCCYAQCRVREQQMLQIITSATEIRIRSSAVLHKCFCRTFKGWWIPLWRLRHSIRGRLELCVGFLLSVQHQDSRCAQLFPGYNTCDIRVRKNKVFFQFLIIKNLLMEVILAWEQMSSIKQQPWNVAQWLVWLLGVGGFFSLLQGTLRLKGYKDIQKFSLSYYIFPIF